jgi:hypothetical protein
MSPQRSRMIEDMIPAWLAGGTQQLYVQGCAGWPRITADRLICSVRKRVRSYLLALRQRGAARGTFLTSHYGLRFSCQHTRGRVWELFGGEKDRLATAAAAT